MFCHTTCYIELGSFLIITKMTDIVADSKRFNLQLHKFLNYLLYTVPVAAYITTTTWYN